MYTSDKQDNHMHPHYLLDGFCNTIEECQLVELDLKGGNFTWDKSRGFADWVRERLDQAFATQAWWQLFLLCNLIVHHTISSNHDPIHLELLNFSHSNKQFRFRFENIWLKEENFHVEVRNYWKALQLIHFMPKLISASSFMAK